MRIVLLIFAILCVASVMPHSDYVVKLGSNLNDKYWKFFKWEKIPSAKRLQSGVFSLLIASAIMFTIILKLHWIALLWMILEIVIGCIYVKASMDIRMNLRGKKHTPTKIERNSGYFTATLLPVCIYMFAFMYSEYEWLLQLMHGK